MEHDHGSSQTGPARLKPWPDDAGAHPPTLRSRWFTYWWLYNGHALATTLRADYRRQQREVRLLLADLYAAGSTAQELTRAQELYAGLTAEDLEDERLWTALFKVHGRLGDSLGLEAAVRRLRTALVELGKGDDPDSAALPPGLERVLKDVRAAIGQQSSAVA